MQQFTKRIATGDYIRCKLSGQRGCVTATERTGGQTWIYADMGAGYVRAFRLTDVEECGAPLAPSAVPSGNRSSTGAGACPPSAPAPSIYDGIVASGVLAVQAYHWWTLSQHREAARRRGELL